MGILWRNSGQICRDNSDVRAVEAKAYFYQGATTTPITVYQDSDEATPHENPVEADSNGRWPAVFIPFRASFDEKVTTSGGTQLWYFQEIPNPDPIEASTATVTDDQKISTGQVIWEPVGGTKTGYVRCNGRTIGSAASGATERANADVEDLYGYLWNGLANGQAAVSGGRGGSAAADFAANKTIALPDLRFATIKGVSDMGNTAISVNSVVTINNGTATTAGSSVGAQFHTLSTAELASHSHGTGTYSAVADGIHTHGVNAATGQTGTTSNGHTHTFEGTASGTVSGGVSGVISGAAAFNVTPTGATAVHRTADYSAIAVSTTISGTTGAQSADHTHAVTIDNSTTHTHNLSGSSGSSGSGFGHNNEPPAILGTFFLKL